MAKQTKPWINYGDINFIEHGGFLVKEDDYKDCFHVIFLQTHIDYDYKGDYKIPMIVAKCYIDLSCWLEDKEDREKVNHFVGNDKDFIPQTLEEKMSYCVDLINYYGIQEFDPDFPKETGCGCYAIGTVKDWIVGKTIVQRFLKEYDVPLRYRRTTMLDKRGA